MIDDDLEEARIMAGFITGLRRETIRLKKHKRLQEHELLILRVSAPG